ncbi:MAG TPA: class I SAM-dependent methyltransferase [Bryobacteraceae bacterium]|nr:class I SAM-dependent methyltransferase [Bryobacteraceae bacterium]
MTSRFPRWLAGTALERHVLHFEALIERAAARFAQDLAAGSRVLDAGCGEGRYARYFGRHRYVGVDLAVGDASWDYTRVHALADLAVLPFAAESFDACLNIVTLEHVPEPRAALGEMCRVLKPGGRLLLAVPHEWEIHQAPNDYFRFTAYGVRRLLEAAGFEDLRIEPAGGFFRLLSRRLLNSLRFFPAPLVPLVALLAAPPALLLPALDFLDRERVFTLGYICAARKSC